MEEIFDVPMSIVATRMHVEEGISACALQLHFLLTPNTSRRRKTDTHHKTESVLDWWIGIEERKFLSLQSEQVDEALICNHSFPKFYWNRMNKRLISYVLAVTTLANSEASFCQPLQWTSDRKHHFISNLPIDPLKERCGTSSLSTNSGWYRNVQKAFRKGRTNDSLKMTVLVDQGTGARKCMLQPKSFQTNAEGSQSNALVETVPDYRRDASVPAVQSQDGSVAVRSTTQRARKRSPYRKIARAWIENILAGRLNRWSRGLHNNLNVICEPKSHFIQTLRGQIRCDASVDFDRIIFGTIRFSKGIIKAIDFGINFISGPRYPNQFDLVAQNLTFTQVDLFESSCIRNGLRRLATRMLKNRGMDAYATRIKSIQILPNNKISCVGEAAVLLGPSFDFEVRTGLGFSHRGHRLDFPGLEIALNPAIGLYVPIPDISLDLGNNAHIHNLVLDSDKSALILSAKVTITPDHTLKVKNYRQSSRSIGAICAVDVGRWLTKLGHFTK